MSTKTKHLTDAAASLRAGMPLTEETAALLADVLEGEAKIRETQPAGFYEVPLDALATQLLRQADVEPTFTRTNMRRLIKRMESAEADLKGMEGLLFSKEQGVALARSYVEEFLRTGVV